MATALPGHVASAATPIAAQTAVAGPGYLATASPRTASPPPTRPPTMDGPAVLTVADNGARVRLHPGQRVTVTLTAQGVLSWDVPTGEGGAVRRTGASGGYPGKQPARATFVAVQAGTAVLSATSDTACLHARPPCELAQQAWRVTVVVTAGDPLP